MVYPVSFPGLCCGGGGKKLGSGKRTVGGCSWGVPSGKALSISSVIVAGAGAAPGEGEGDGDASDFGSSANAEPNSRKMATTQTLDSIQANAPDITTPREPWLASSPVASLREWHKK